MENLILQFLKAECRNDSIIIKNYYTDGAICYVEYYTDDSMYYTEHKNINIWNILKFLYENK